MQTLSCSAAPRPACARRRPAPRACASPAADGAAAARRPVSAASAAQSGRRAALLSAFAAAAAPGAAVAAGSPLDPARNTVVLEQLKALERRRAVDSGDLGSRLGGALGQLQRCRRLAADGCAPPAPAVRSRVRV